MILESDNEESEIVSLVISFNHQSCSRLHEAPLISCPSPISPCSSLQTTLPPQPPPTPPPRFPLQPPLWHHKDGRRFLWHSAHD